MENRYKLPKNIQTGYFNNLERTANPKGDQLAVLFGVVGRTYRDWKRGKFAIPTRVVEIIEQKFHVDFPYSKAQALSKWQESKRIVSSKGGIALFLKRGGPGTLEGRKKGGKRALALLRERGIIPIEKLFLAPKHYSIKLAELIGILLGDGHIGKEQWSITLNATADKLYSTYVMDLIKDLFLLSPSILHRKKINVFVIYGGGKKNIEYFQKIGLHIGNKIKLQVGVPDWILHHSQYRKACLRGLMDTDGGIFIHKYFVHKKLYSYTKLCFSNRSIPLVNFVYDTLAMLKLQPRLNMGSQTKRVWLYDQDKVNEYLHVVTTHNPRLLKNIGGVR